MPRDLFQERGIKVDMPRDLFEEKGINPNINSISSRNENSISDTLANLGVGLSTSLRDATLGAGDSLANQMRRLMGMNKFHSSEGTSYNVGSTIGDILPYMAVPEANLGKIGTAIESIPAIGKFASGAASRILPQSGLSALLNDNPIESAKKAAEIQGAMELLPVPFKIGGSIIGKAAETINPQKFALKKIEDIKKDYRNALSLEKLEYKPVMDKYGESPSFSESYLKNYKKYGDKFGPKVEDFHEEFMKNPTIEKAHKLQSQMFSEISRLSKNKQPDQHTIDRIYALSKSRNALKNDLMSSLMSLDKDAYLKYNKGSEIHRYQVSPYLSNSTIANIVEGGINKRSPSELMNAIKKSRESKKLPENHYLRKVEDELYKKINKGKLIENIGALTAGGLAGEMIAPGFGGGAAGAALAKFLSPTMVKIAQNPDLQNLSNKFNKPIDLIKRAILGYNMQQE